MPVALRTVSPAAIVQEYEPGAAAVASHVQSTSWLVPVPVATIVPVESATVTVQGSASERRARKRTCPPIAPRAVGA